MTPTALTHADQATLDALSDLCLRSKAFWGYDDAFMDACVDVLRIRADHLKEPVAVTKDGAEFTGIVCLALSEDPPHLSKLFVCPDHMGQGIGSALIRWAKQMARQRGIPALLVESDPQAVPFYSSHGAYQVGEAPSEAIAGRMLPLLALPVQTI